MIDCWTILLFCRCLCVCNTLSGILQLIIILYETAWLINNTYQWYGIYYCLKKLHYLGVQIGTLINQTFYQSPRLVLFHLNHINSCKSAHVTCKVLLSSKNFRSKFFILLSNVLILKVLPKVVLYHHIVSSLCHQ